MSVQRWKCVCAYDGTGLDGWQSQSRGGGMGIQDVIETRIAEIFKAPIRIHGSGRTDAGVHARGQVFHFDAAWSHGTAKLLLALGARLPPAIQIKSVRPARPDFHARFGAKGKRYDYYVHLGEADPFGRAYCWSVYRPLDLDAMRAAAAVLVGTHDFRAFTAINGPVRKDTVRELRQLTVARRGRRVQITAEAGGFLYKMVRTLAGVLVAVGEGRLSVDDVRKLLHTGVRTVEVQTAPAQGLFLTKVSY